MTNDPFGARRTIATPLGEREMFRIGALADVGGYGHAGIACALGVSGTAGVEDALGAFRDYLMSETLATGWETGQASPLWSEERTLDDERWTIEISRPHIQVA